MRICTGGIINPPPIPAVGLPETERLAREQRQSTADYLPAPEDIGKPLAVFLGGFLDASTLQFYNTALEYRDGPRFDAPPPAFSPERPFPWPEQRRGMAGDQDIYYRSHDTRGYISRLMDVYHRAGRPIALIGHSWGGASAYKLALKSGLPVDLLVTLDPVSVFPLGERRKPRNVRHWVNVYLDFKRADMTDSSNLTAWVGRPWGAGVKADVNHDFTAAWPGGTLPGHAWCYEMFNFYARSELERVG